MARLKEEVVRNEGNRETGDLKNIRKFRIARVKIMLLRRALLNQTSPRVAGAYVLLQELLHLKNPHLRFG